MSDLQCAARVFVARHGEAEYESELLSDAGGSLSTAGPRAGGGAGSERSPGSASPTSTCSSLSRAVQTGEIVAARLDVDVVGAHALREFSVGSLRRAARGPGSVPAGVRGLARRSARDADPGRGVVGAEVVERMGGVLDEIADAPSRRGACSSSATVARSVRRSPTWLLNLERRGSRQSRPLVNCDVVELAADSDGWIARSWAGEVLPTVTCRAN